MDREQPVQAAVPADLNTPDKVLYGLTARQLAILAGTGAVLWLTYHLLAPFVPPIAVVIAAIPIGALAAAVALGRRDGLTLDRWLAAALRAARSPHRMVAAPAGTIAVPGWAPATQDSQPTTSETATMPLAPLRLPAHAITAGGVVDVDGARVAVTAASTVNFDLRTAGEQHALVDGMSRWLNSLSGPVEVVISTRRVDMHAYADQVEDRLDLLPHPALADAAAGYATFLRFLAEDRDPLDRHVLIAHQAGPASDPAVARRQAEQTARALTGLGAATRVLDGGQVTDALVGACDPWRYVGAGRATPDAVITGPPNGSLR
jgi:hypothetical protein